MQCWQPDQIGTLVYLRDGADASAPVLLIDKLRGHGQGLVNAPGGKLEANETALQCAAREVREEVGIRPVSLTLRGCLRFVQAQGDQWLGFAYTSHEFCGQATLTAEARPHWCSVEQLPWTQMWPSDRCWLPALLAAPATSPLLFEATCWFDGERLVAAQYQPLTTHHLRRLLDQLGLQHLVTELDAQPTRVPT